jgi:hypothetical protein
MFTLTVGNIAAIINAIITILQLVLPNALILALVAVLSDTHTAVTWSVVARNIQSSHWPLLLRSDSAETNHVHLGSKIITLLRPITLVLVAISAIVTPLGLYQDIAPSDDPQLVDFVRQADEGPFGLLTPPRSNLGFSRECTDGGALPAQCPGTTTVIKYSNDGNVFNATVVNDDYDRRIPVQLAKLYQSGLSSQPDSVSSFFDIQWRWYNTHTRDNIANDSYLVDSYHPIDTVIGDDDFKLIEGLIVDTRNSGVGFRAHTIPVAEEIQDGAEWDEDITFFIPESACEDTNVTLEYSVPGEYDYLSTPVQKLVDQGGFAEASRDNPWDDGWYMDTQQDPQLGARAHRGAWTMNAYNMYYFGVTKPFTNFTAPIDSFVGKKYAVNNSLWSYTSSAPGLMSLATLSLNPYNGLVDVPYTPVTYLNGTPMSNETYMTGFGTETSWRNPYGITTDNFTLADLGCVAFLGGDQVNSTNIQVKCGLVLGPANKSGGSNSLLVEPGSVWSRPVYMCASTTKATIKTVRFKYDPTRGSGIDRLRVQSISDKQYGSKDDMPLWGIETPKMTLNSMTPLWGLIDPQMEDSVNLTTIRADHLYLPASAVSIWQNGLQSDGGTEYMPGTAAPANIWESAYAMRDGSGDTDGLQDLSGWSSLALASRWRNLSATATGTASIMNLIWTDLAANALVGTRGWQSGNSDLPPDLQNPLQKRADTSTHTERGQLPIRIFRPVVRYRWIYGIPAAICLLLAGLICLAALVAVISGRATTSRIRHYLNRLSAGRLLVALRFGTSDFDSGGKFWLGTSGRTELPLPRSDYQDVPTEEQHVVQVKHDDPNPQQQVYRPRDGFI